MLDDDELDEDSDDGSKDEEELDEELELDDFMLDEELELDFFELADVEDEELAIAVTFPGRWMDNHGPPCLRPGGTGKGYCSCLDALALRGQILIPGDP